jgi:hypothetical protein
MSLTRMIPKSGNRFSEKIMRKRNKIAEMLDRRGIKGRFPLY